MNALAIPGTGSWTRIRRAPAGGDGGSRRGPQLRVAELIEDLAEHPGLGTYHRVQGENREFLTEYANQMGITQDWDRPRIPLEALAVDRRDLTAGVAGAGGYLVSAEALAMRELLRPFSLAARLGVEILEAGPSDNAIPVQSTRPTVQWLSSEATEAAASTPQLRSVAVRPKMAAAVVRFSRQLSKQTDGESYARRMLLGAAGIAIDIAAIAGSGASGEPLGLLNTAQVPVVAGASFDDAAAAEMLRTAAAADASDEALRWLADPATRELLQQRERVTGSGRFIWDDDAILNRRADVSTIMPAATLIVGDWQNLALRMWGLTVEISPFGVTTQADSRSEFMTGQIGARVILAVDVGVVHPTAFVKSTGIS